MRNVEYSSTVEELKDHFKDCCGERGQAGILRVTIAKNKFNGHPLGYAYIEFDSVEAAKKSKGLDESLFKGRQLTVLDKRKNLPKLGNKIKRGGQAVRGRGKQPNYMMRGGRGGLQNPQMMMLNAAMMMQAASAMQANQFRGSRGRGRGAFRGRPFKPRGGVPIQKNNSEQQPEN